MTSIVFQYGEIHALMKGDLKKQPIKKEPSDCWRCDDRGWIMLNYNGSDTFHTCPYCENKKNLPCP